MVTDGNDYTFEIGLPKVGKLSERFYVMEAGGTFRGQQVLDNFSIKYTFDELSKMQFHEIVTEFSKEFKKTLNTYLESEILERRGLTKKSFYDNFDKFPQSLALSIDQQIRNFDFGVNFILMGFDINQEQRAGQAHIYKINEEGEMENFDRLGFVMIGIGETLSLPEYTQEKYSPHNSIDDAMVRTYWAKRTSERMAGVGRTTDFGIIWLQAEDDESEIKCYDVNIDPKVVKEYLDEPFEKTRNEMGQMKDGIKAQLNNLMNGEKSNSS
ncbi:MAG: hypothetical protein ACE5DL_02325 [Nitrosopumilaceae archaeon]